MGKRMLNVLNYDDSNSMLRSDVQSTFLLILSFVTWTTNYSLKLILKGYNLKGN